MVEVVVVEELEFHEGMEEQGEKVEEVEMEEVEVKMVAQEGREDTVAATTPLSVGAGGTMQIHRPIVPLL